jgi:hypothetical protein
MGSMTISSTDATRLAPKMIKVLVQGLGIALAQAR